MFASQRAFRLRLFCTHRTPVSKTLDYWPDLPIVMEYGGSPALDPPAPEDEDNIMAAIKQSDRVSHISLIVTRSLLKRLSAIEMRFLELEDLVLLSRYSVQPIQPRAFRWGSRLRRLHLAEITFLALMQHLSSSRDLVGIQLHDISDHTSGNLRRYHKVVIM